MHIQLIVVRFTLSVLTEPITQLPMYIRSASFFCNLHFYPRNGMYRIVLQRISAITTRKQFRRVNFQYLLKVNGIANPHQGNCECVKLLRRKNVNEITKVARCFLLASFNFSDDMLMHALRIH